MLFSVLVIILLISQLLYSQDIQQGEFMVVNNTGKNGYQIKVDIYPVGAIFNGNDQYTLNAANQVGSYNKIWGVEQYPLTNNQTTQNWYARINFDKTSDIYECHFPLGYGRYRIDFYEGANKTFACDIDFSDANFTGISTSTYYQKLRIDYYASNDVKLQFYGTNTSPYSITNGEKICVWEQKGTVNGTQAQNKGIFTDYSLDGQQYHNYPVNAVNYGFFRHVTPEEVYLNLSLENFDAYSSIAELKFKGSVFSLNSGREFSMSGMYSTITINGEGGKFISGENSTLNLPLDGSLVINEPASIESNGTKFTSLSSTEPWLGLQINNPQSSIINNCKFWNTAKPITVFGNNCLITNNKFHIIPDIGSFMPQSWGILLNEVRNASIIKNQFWLPEDPSLDSYGIIIMNTPSTEEENNDAPWYSLNIIGNEFYNGNKQIWADGSLNLSPIYMKDNWFNDGVTNIELWFFVGNISDNHFVNTLTSPNVAGISLNGSKPNLLNNEINSQYNNIVIRYASYPNLAPLIIDNQFLWKGGKNKLNSSLNWNVDINTINNPGYFFTDQGKNQFNTSGTNFHFKGYLDDSANVYYTNGNCWYSNNQLSSPIIELRRPNDNSLINYIWNDPPNCNWDEQIVDRIINDKGSGIFDTILITQSNIIPPPSTDEALYATGAKNKELKLYSDAILNYKNLISNYSKSKYLESAIFDLYECYAVSDTNHNQGWRNIIFGDLNNFLEEKIQQYENNEDFVIMAFNFALKCKVKIKSYQPAMDGYEFIAENSPSSAERLIASINYIEVEGLIQGGNGGGVMENKNAFKALGNIRKQENKTPIKDILLKVYSKSKETKRQKEDLDLQKSNDVSKTRADLDRKHNFEKTIEYKALNNLSISGSLNAEQRRERIRKDLLFLTQRESENNTIKEINSLPINYSLSQNYPNPFNPATKINFAIPKQGFVTLKIYDIIGREIKTLVNEVKQAGYYTVDFNGSSLASGVYFYRIQSGDFVTVKRMVLVK